MNRSRRVRQALFLSLVCILGWALSMGRAHAAVSCTATMSDVDFGSSVDLVAGVGLTANGTLSYTCTNDASSATFASVCFNVGDGNEGLGNFNPRLMKSGSNPLQFQLYQSPGSTIWGWKGNPTVPSPFTANLTIPKRVSGVNGSISGSTIMQGQLLLGQGAAPAGSYQDFFSAAGGHTNISWTNGSSAPSGCSGTSSGNFPFTVKAVVIKSCTVTAGAASNIQLGAASGVDSTATNITGSSSISVTCTGATPYFIGLAPSNNSTTGAGIMAAMNVAPVTGNTDTVPYQLRSTTGMGGSIWGNTATATAVGNGVAGTGTGLAQTIPVYATTPSANFTPDSYQDTVTVNVRY